MWILLLMIAVMPFEMNPYLTISQSFLGLLPNFTVIKLLGIVIQAGLAGYMIAATFLSAQYEKFFWLIAFLSITLERVLGQAANPEENQIAEAALVEEPVWTWR